MSEETNPYVHGLAAACGVVLASALGLAIVDIVHAGGGALALLAFWSMYALPLALGVGVVLGAGNATWGIGFVRRGFGRLRADADLDRKVVAALVAGAVFAGVLLVLVGKLSVGLVGNVQRKAVGGLLLGAVVVGVLPVLALAALPVYRAIHRAYSLIPDVPAFGRAVNRSVGSRTVLVVVGALVAGVVGVRAVMLGGLDTEKLHLDSLIAIALLPVIAAVLGLLMYGPLGRVREGLPGRAGLAGVGVIIAMSMIYVGMRAQPSAADLAAVTEHSYLGSRAVPLLRGFIDHDGDGYSAFFGGDDCNDNDASVHPGAVDVPDDGIDQNCIGGDAHKATPVPVAKDPKDDPKAPPAVTGGDNVLIVFVDTLRADRLGAFGYQRDGKSLTPNLDKLAADAVVFKHAYAQAPNTPRSVPSFMSSRFPSQVKYDKVFKSYPTVLDDNDLLFEVMKGAGFTTIGETSHFYFCDRKKYPDTCGDVVSWMQSNITQGADVWDNSGALNIPESNKDSAGPRTVDKAIKKLDELAKPAGGKPAKFAMLVHLFEPHSTYMPHPGQGAVTETGAKALEHRYDNEVAFTDEQIGKLFAALDANGLAKTTTVIVMADHGEAFGVHVIAGERDFFHGDSLYSELLHVPLMVKVPGGKACTRDEVVQLVDLAPTIAGLYGVAPAPTWQGRSLVPALACGAPLPPQPAFAELLRAPDWDHEAKSMITADHMHVYFRSSDSKWEIYDLTKDPDEKTDLADGNPKLAEYKQQLAAWIEGPLATGGGR